MRLRRVRFDANVNSPVGDGTLYAGYVVLPEDAPGGTRPLHALTASAALLARIEVEDHGPRGTWIALEAKNGKVVLVPYTRALEVEREPPPPPIPEPAPTKPARPAKEPKR